MTYPAHCGGYLPKGDPGPPGPPGTLLNSWRGAWQAGADYAPGDLVYHEGSAYLYGAVLPAAGGPLFASYGGSTPEPPAHPWELFTRRGSDGDTPGTGLNWRGGWMPDETYGEGSVVELAGTAYVAAIDVPAGVAPPEGPWEVLAERGTQGEKGDPGPAGPAYNPHWLGLEAAFSNVASGADTALIVGSPIAGSDLEWYTLGPAGIYVKHAGVYQVTAQLVADVQPTPQLTGRRLRIARWAYPVAEERITDTGATWATTLAAPPVRVPAPSDVPAESAFLISLQQESGGPAAGTLRTTIVYLGP